MVNPRDFLPGPFSRMTVWKVQIVERGLRGKVQKFVVLRSVWGLGLEGKGVSMFLDWVAEPVAARRKT